jgi:hypothetical protein
MSGLLKDLFDRTFLAVGGTSDGGGPARRRLTLTSTDRPP